MVALAAISDSNSKEAEVDEELNFKPVLALQSPGSNKKAVAIVRPQPQQQVITSSSEQAKNNNESNNNRGTEERDARFSLYDFTSDSEEDHSRPSQPVTSGKKESGKSKPFKKQFAQGKKLYPPAKIEKKPENKENPQSKASTQELDPGQSSSECKVKTSTHPKEENAEKMQDQDVVVQQQSSSPDSGVSSLKVEASGSSSSNSIADRSGSRSSTLSSGDDSVKAVKASNTSMGDRQQQQQQAAAAVAAAAAAAASAGRPPATTMSAVAAAASAAVPTSAAAASLNAHYAALSQYQAAAMALSQAAAANPMAAQQAQLLAQYQQQFANSLTPTPDMIIKQYPHLAAGLSGPPHLLGRIPGAEHQMHMLREREMAAERERQLR